MREGATHSCANQNMRRLEMKKLILAAAIATLALNPAMANEMDTTLTEEEGVLEEQESTSMTNENYYFPPKTENDTESDDEIQSGATAESLAPVNESLARAPRGIDNRGSWNVTAGPALTVGLESDNVLYGVSGGYTFNLTPSLGARTFADANFGVGDDSAQFLAVGIAAKLGVGEIIDQQPSKAYLLGDVSLASARNADTDNSESGAAVGAGVGYNLNRGQRTDIDLLLRYSLMLSEVDDKLPSLLTARLGVNF
jgi:opacity protein-like surface antigen